jgi:hypothetical protein
MDLILGETPRSATSVPQAWLFEDEDDDEYEDELRMSRSASLPAHSSYSLSGSGIMTWHAGRAVAIASLNQANDGGSP